MDLSEPLRSNAPPPVPLLDIKDLTVEFSTRRGIVQAVKSIDLQVAKGETVGIVGESGSGKSVTSFAVMRILDRAGRIAEGAGFMVSGEWWIALFPGLALMIAVFCFNLLGDGLRDIVDPQRRT